MIGYRDASLDDEWFSGRVRALTLTEARATVRHWSPAVLSAAGAVGLSLFLAFHNYQVDIDVYRMGGHTFFSSGLYSARFGNSGLLFTYTPFAALAFALLTFHLGLWTLQCEWALTNVLALVALIRLSLRLVAPDVQRSRAAWWTMCLLLPALALNPVFTTIGLGQINLVLCVLVVWDLTTDRRIGTRSVPLGIATGIAAAIKLTPLVFVPYLLITRRSRGALRAVITFVACEAAAFLASPGTSWTYWTKDVLDSKRAGALLYASDQNLASVLQRVHHGPVPAVVLVPALAVIGVAGLALAAWAYRRSSPLLGLLVCATTGLIVSPITWVHHMVWVVPTIIWLAAGADRPKRGPVMAGAAACLFVVAPIWWVPTSWSVSARPPELHWHGWQLLAGNSFLLSMLGFLAGVTVMLVRRHRSSLSGTPPRTPPDRQARRALSAAAASTTAAGGTGGELELVG